MQPSKVNCKYGAPMGRPAEHASDVKAPIVFKLERWHLDAGGYDQGGAYWGALHNLWVAYAGQDDADPVCVYVRGDTRAVAESEVQATYPRATFEACAPAHLDDFFSAYITAALWSTHDNADESGGEPLDANYGPGDIAPETLARMRADCAAFLTECGAMIDGCAPSVDCDKWEHAGHDFWLTREGHGCGFWDGRWPEPWAAALTKAAKVFHGFDLCVGDDGQIWH